MNNQQDTNYKQMTNDKTQIKNNKEAGFTLVEVVVAIGLILSLSLGMMAVNSLTAASLVQNQNESVAGELAREAMEAVQSVRARSFPSLSVGEFHPVYDGTNWSLVPGNEVVDGFRRKVVFSPVQRTFGCGENVCDVVEAGGVIDEWSLKVLVEVEWDEAKETRKFSLGGYVTYWR